MLGHRERHVAPAVHQPTSTWPAATRSTVSQGSRSVTVRDRSGCASRRWRSAGATRPRTAVEKAASRRWPATVPALPVQPGLDLLEVAEQPAAVVDQLPPGAGEHHPAARPARAGAPRSAARAA